MAEAWGEGRRVDSDELRDVVMAVFRRCGMDETEAARCGIFSRTGGEAP